MINKEKKNNDSKLINYKLLEKGYQSKVHDYRPLTLSIVLCNRSIKYISSLRSNQLGIINHITRPKKRLISIPAIDSRTFLIVLW